MATVYSGVSKNLTNPLIKKGIIGEDAWFIASHNNYDVMGVADGVGGWQSVGIDPSIFSSNLMRQCKRLVETDEKELFNNKTTTVSLVTPMKLLEESYKNLVSRKDEQLVGSATACILLFDREINCLYTANLGDSGFVV